MKFKKLMKTMSLKHASNKAEKRQRPASAYAKSLYPPSTYNNLVLFPVCPSQHSLHSLSSYNSSIDNSNTDNSSGSEYVVPTVCPRTVSKVASANHQALMKSKRSVLKPAPPSPRSGDPRVGLRLNLHGHGRETTPTPSKRRDNRLDLHGPERSPSPTVPSRELRLDLHGPEISLDQSEDECTPTLNALSECTPALNALSPETSCFGVGSQWQGLNSSFNKLKRRSSRLFKKKERIASDSTESSIRSDTMPSPPSSLHFLPTCGGTRRVSNDLFTSSTPSEHIGIQPISDESTLSNEDDDMFDAESVSYNAMRVPKFYGYDKLSPLSLARDPMAMTNGRNRGSVETVGTSSGSPAQSSTSTEGTKSYILETIITWTSLHGLEEGDKELNEMIVQWAKKKRIILNTETRYCQTVVI